MKTTTTTKNPRMHLTCDEGITKEYENCLPVISELCIYALHTGPPAPLFKLKLETKSIR